MTMTHWILAQKFDDWIEIAIFAVVVLGSLAANAWSEISKRWGKKAQQQAENAEPAAPGRSMPPVAPPGKFEFPTARPMPPRPYPSHEPRRQTIAQQRAEVAGDADKQLRRRTAEASPGRSERARRREAQDGPTRPKEQPIHAPPPRRPRVEQPSSAPQRPKISADRARHEVMDVVAPTATIDANIPDISTADIDDSIAPKLMEMQAGRPRISPANVRNGIILAEILGKPVSLR